jgi:hypothetical protein
MLLLFDEISFFGFFFKQSSLITFTYIVYVFIVKFIKRLEFVFAIIDFRVSVRIILVQIPTVFRFVIYSSADKTLIKAFSTSRSAISHFIGKVVPVAPLRRMLPPSCQVFAHAFGSFCYSCAHIGIWGGLLFDYT